MNDNCSLSFSLFLSDSHHDSDREAVLKPNLGKFVRTVPISGGGWERMLSNQNLVRTKQRKQRKRECVG